MCIDCCRKAVAEVTEIASQMNLPVEFVVQLGIYWSLRQLLDRLDDDEREVWQG